MSINYNQFLDPNDPEWELLNNRKDVDPRWSKCPPGKSFFVPVPEHLVKAKKKRPTIPSQFAGLYNTKAVRYLGEWGYRVTRKEDNQHQYRLR